MTRGLVIGKFYPPHRGHRHLIETARAGVDHLSIIVCGKAEQEPPGELRAAWLQEMHPNAHVLLVDDCLDPDDSAAWADYSVHTLGFTPDVVFTSEAYGDPFARCLGCRHVSVDLARTSVPISGTLVRADSLRWWEFLDPLVRGYYAKRICLVGAESTGKTTLAAALAEHYETCWVPEFGREYSERQLAVHGAYDWRSDDFVWIAETQCRHEDAAARLVNRVLICDTDAFATSIWHRRYMGHPSPEVEAIAAAHRRPDLYLLTDVHTPFDQDGTRDGELIREWMHAEFITELTAQGRPFVHLSGTHQERMRVAVAAIDGVLRLRAGA